MHTFFLASCNITCVPFAQVAVYKAVRAIADIPVNLVKEWTQSLPKTLLEGCSKVCSHIAHMQLNRSLLALRSMAGLRRSPLQKACLAVDPSPVLVLHPGS